MQEAGDGQLPRLLVADSFRVRGMAGAAESRGFQLHVQRFQQSVREMLEGDARTGKPAIQAFLTHELPEFMHEATSRINNYGEGNPRLELWSADPHSCGIPVLKLSLRPLPKLFDTVKLRSVAAVETVHAEHKGPNIGLFTKLNRELGAEALLLDADGTVIEGATTAIVWWEGDTGYVSVQTRRVRSVAETLVQRIALAHGQPLRAESVTPNDLLQHEAWAVNALHGIRRVTEIDGIASPTHRAESTWSSLDQIRQSFDNTWQRIQ